MSAPPKTETDFDRIESAIDVWTRMESNKDALSKLALIAHSCDSIQSSRNEVFTACRALFAPKTAAAAAKKFMRLSGSELETALAQPWAAGKLQNAGIPTRIALNMGWANAQDLDGATIDQLQTLRESTRKQAADEIQLRSSITGGIDALTAQNIQIGDFTDAITFGSRVAGAFNQKWHDTFNTPGHRQDALATISPASLNDSFGKIKRQYRQDISNWMQGLNGIDQGEIPTERVVKTIERANALGLQDISRTLTEWAEITSSRDTTAQPELALSGAKNGVENAATTTPAKSPIPSRPNVRPDR